MRGAHDSTPTVSRWQTESIAAHYAEDRFAGHHGDRDLRLARRLIERFDHGASSRSVLDVPAGTGRLREGLVQCSTSVFGVDVSPAMLQRSGYSTDGCALVADAHRLPFRDAAFDVVVSCRLLHHLDEDRVALALREFLRVSNRLVVASFWDQACFTETRKRLGLRPRTDARRAISRQRLASIVQQAGGRVLGHASSFRFFSPQTFVALR